MAEVTAGPVTPGVPRVSPRAPLRSPPTSSGRRDRRRTLRAGSRSAASRRRRSRSGTTARASSCKGRGVCRSSDRDAGTPRARSRRGRSLCPSPSARRRGSRTASGRSRRRRPRRSARTSPGRGRTSSRPSAAAAAGPTRAAEASRVRGRDAAEAMGARPAAPRPTRPPRGAREGRLAFAVEPSAVAFRARRAGRHRGELPRRPRPSGRLDRTQRTRRRARASPPRSGRLGCAGRNRAPSWARSGLVCLRRDPGARGGRARRRPELERARGDERLDARGHSRRVLSEDVRQLLKGRATVDVRDEERIPRLELHRIEIRLRPVRHAPEAGRIRRADRRTRARGGSDVDVSPARLRLSRRRIGGRALDRAERLEPRSNRDDLVHAYPHRVRHVGERREPIDAREDEGLERREPQPVDPERALAGSSVGIHLG